jgi:hypothetical protein
MESGRAGNSQGMYQQAFQFMGGPMSQISNKFQSQNVLKMNGIPGISPIQSSNICRFCQRTIPMGGMDSHTSACEENPDNIILPCDFCGEHYSLNELEKHLGACGLNPSNQKIVCESCGSQVSLVQFENHIMNCNGHHSHYQKTGNKAATNTGGKMITCMMCNAQVEWNDYGKHITTSCSENFVPIMNTTKGSPMKKEEEKEKECAICFLEFGPLQEVKFLQCFHRYHKACIDSWNKKVRSCPICLTSIDE